MRDRYTPEDDKLLGETTNWTQREATAADVANGDAHAVGNLILVHKTGGTKDEIPA